MDVVKFCILTRFAEAVKNIAKLREIDDETYFYRDESNTQLCQAQMKLGKLEEAKQVHIHVLVCSSLRILIV